MAARPSRRRHRQNEPVGTRELILAEATRLIARDGVEEMKVKDVADAVGIQAPTVYRHFASREAIIAALATAMVDDLAQFLSPDPGLTPLAWVESWAKGLVWFFASRPAYVRMLLRDLATPGGFAPLTAAFGAVADTPKIDAVVHINERFRAVYLRGVDDGVFRPGLSPTFFSLMFGAILVSIVWPYAGGNASMGVHDIERLQANAVSIALALLKPA